MNDSNGSLQDRIVADMKDAMRARQRERLGTIRLILAAIKQREVDERITLDDSQVLAVLDKMVKQRRDSIEQFERGGREDLVAKERVELELIQTYLPAGLDESEIEALIETVLAATGATSIKDMGRVMGELRPQVQGRADMGQVSARVKARLGS